MAKTTLAEAKNIKRIKYPWKSDLKNSLRIFVWKPIIANKTAASNKNNCRYSPRVPSGLLQPGENISKNIPVIPNNNKNTKNMIFTFFENNLYFPLLHNSSTMTRDSPYTFCWNTPVHHKHKNTKISPQFQQLSEKFSAPCRIKHKKSEVLAWRTNLGTPILLLHSACLAVLSRRSFQ